MKILTLETLQTLLDYTNEQCVSLYMETHPTGREQQQDPIRLKNLLAKASQQLADHGLRKPAINQRLAPAEELLSDKHFWQHQSKGLAIFLGYDFSSVNRLSTVFEDLVVVTDKFHLKPLLPMVSKNHAFYILAISLNTIRLFKADRFQINEIHLEETPESLQEALRFDDPEQQIQYHTSSANPSGQSTRPSMFHGQGAKDSDEKTEILRFFNKVDTGIKDFLQDKGTPLMIMGVDYLLPIYQEANSYPYLVETAVIGNPEELSQDELHQKAWKVMEPSFHQDRQNDLQRFRQLDGSNHQLASHQLSDIITAGYDGRIEVLFVELNTQVWGKYDESQRTVKIHDQFQRGDRDLLDETAFQTLKHGGNVYALASDAMPSPKVAAIYRY